MVDRQWQVQVESRNQNLRSNMSSETTKMQEHEHEHEYEYAMQLANASVLPMVLKAAIELGVLVIMKKAGPGALLSAHEIASQLPTHNPHAPLLLERMLRLLSAYSILTCSQDRHDDGKLLSLYGLAPISNYFVPNHDQVSLAPLLSLNQDKAFLHAWYHLKDAVLEGDVPFNRAHGMKAVEYMSKDVRFSELFKCSMKEFNHIFMETILEAYKGFEGLTSLTDVGGGDGSILKMIVSKYPTITAINFDLAAVILNSVSHPGIKHIAGDMFASIPKADAIFMKWILHNWDDEHCLAILKNCYEALPEHGKVIVVELVIVEAPETSLAARSLFQLDMFMVNTNLTGKERTEREIENLAKQAGFSRIQLACSAYNYSVVELFKSA